MSVYKSTKNELDPLDGEILEWALDVTWEATKGIYQHFDADSDEELEAEVRRELIEIARINGVSDPETLKDILLASMQASGDHGAAAQDELERLCQSAREAKNEAA